jgi:hypothetical protein
MLVYDHHGHSFHLLDIESDRVITATHVTFDEHARSCPDNSFVGENVANTSTNHHVTANKITKAQKI